MNKRKMLLTILLIAVSLRIGGNIVREKVFFHKPFFLSGPAYYNSITSDSVWYDDAARALLIGKGVAALDWDRWNRINFHPWIGTKKIDDRYRAHKAIPPLYPMFLAFCYYLFGFNTLAYFIPQLIISSLTCIFVYSLAEDLYGRKAASFAGLAAAFYPDLIFWTNFIRTETLFIFLLTAGFCFLVRGNIRGDGRLVCSSAVFFGLASLTRITFIPFIPLLFIWQIFFFTRNRMKNLKISLSAVLIMILILIPWCARNYMIFGKFTPFSDEVYAFLLDGNNRDLDKTEHYFNLRSSLVSRAVGFIKARPKEYALYFLKNFMIFWSPYTASMKKSAKIYKGLTWLIIFPLSFFGMAVSRKTWRRSGILVIFIIFYSILHAASSVGFGLVYRYPIQPFLCVFAAYGFCVIYEKTRSDEILIHHSDSQR